MYKTKKLICQILMIALILGMTTPVFAAGNDGTDSHETGPVTIGFQRLSNTSAESVISATMFGVATYIKGTITLQEYRNGSWVTATGVSPVTKSATVYNTGNIYMTNDWNLTKGKNYRLKFVCTDKTGSITSTSTLNSNAI